MKIRTRCFIRILQKAEDSPLVFICPLAILREHEIRRWIIIVQWKSKLDALGTVTDRQQFSNFLWLVSSLLEKLILAIESD